MERQVIVPANVDMQEMVRNPFLLNLLKVNMEQAISNVIGEEDLEYDSTLEEGVT